MRKTAYLIFLATFCFSCKKIDNLSPEDRWAKGRCIEVECTKEMGGGCFKGFLAGAMVGVPQSEIHAKGIECVNKAEKEAKMSAQEYMAMSFKMVGQCQNGNKKSCAIACCEDEEEECIEESTDNKDKPKNQWENARCKEVQCIKTNGGKCVNGAVIYTSRFVSPAQKIAQQECSLNVAKEMGTSIEDYKNTAFDFINRCQQGDKTACAIGCCENNSAPEKPKKICKKKPEKLPEEPKEEICKEEKEELQEKIQEEMAEIDPLLETVDTSKENIFLAFCPSSGENLYIPDVPTIYGNENYASKQKLCITTPDQPKCVFPCKEKEAKYWNFALAFLIQELLHYKKFSISEDDAAGLLSKILKISSAAAPNTQISGEVFAAVKTETDLWVAGLQVSASLKDTLKGAGNFIGFAGLILNAAENLTDQQKRELFVQMVKTRGILGCLTNDISSCLAVLPETLKNAIDSQNALEEYLAKTTGDTKYQILKTATQMLTMLASGGILAAAGITVAAVGAPVVAVAGILLGVGVAVGFDAYKEYENSIFYYRVSSLLYTLAKQISGTDPQCLFLKAATIHTANTLMDKYVLGKIYGFIRNPGLMQDNFGPFFPSDKEIKWENYTNDYFDRLHFIINWWGGKGELISPMEDLADCLEEHNAGKICLNQ